MNPARSFAVNPNWQLLMADLEVDPGNVLRRAGLPADLFTRLPAALAPTEFFRLWEALDEECGLPNLALLIGGALSVEAFEPPVFAALCSPNLSVAARRVARYKRLIGPLELPVREDQSNLELEFIWPAGLSPPPALALAELVFWVALARIATRTEVRPVRLTVPEPPADREAYREYLGADIGTGRQYAITFSARDAARPFLTANESMWEFFEPELRKRLSELDDGSSMTERVRAVLLELLPAGEATMDAVAHRLATSTRTLQRRLRDENTTFQESLNSTREALARHYLASSDLSAGEISFLLGYEDPNSFYRAFQSWTGQTPDRVRMAMTGAG